MRLESRIGAGFGLRFSWRTSYDPASNRITLTNPGGVTTTAVYDAVNRLTQMTQGTLTWTFGYDGAGNRTSQTHPNGTRTDYAYLTNHWLSSITHKKSSGSPFQSFAYTYDPNGNRLTQVDSTGTTTFTYDALNRLTSAAYPGYGTRSWTYDAVGNRTSQEYPCGSAVCATVYTYDANNRLTQAGSTTYGYDNNGNLLTISTGGTFTWDVFNRLTQATGAGGTVTYTYNGDGLKVRRVATPADTTLTFGVGGAGWLPLRGDWNGDGTDTVGAYNPATGTFYLRNSNTTGTADLTFVFGPAAAGRIPLAGDWDGNGTDTIGVYDPATGTFSLRNSNTSGPADLTFVFGAPGLTPLAGDWNGDRTDTIGVYNGATATFSLRNTNSAGAADVTFVYGPAGAGRQPVTGDWNGDALDTIGVYDPATATFYLRNSNSAGAADLTFTYGPAGAGWKPLAGDWNGDGTDTVGVYNPATGAFTLRNASSAGAQETTNYYYDGLRPIWETDGAGALLSQEDRDIFGNLVSRRLANNARRYYHYDGLGSTTALTTETGTVAATLLFDAWGSVRAASGGGQGNYRFAGAELDTTTGLYHMGARFYDPAVGRWLSEDPVQDKPFEPATLNFYAYVNGNPLVLVDQDGHAAAVALLAFGLVAPGLGGALLIAAGVAAVGIVAYTAAGVITAMGETKQAKTVAAGQLATALDHAGKLATPGGPRDPRGGWERELLDKLRTIKEKVDKLGKSYEQILREHYKGNAKQLAKAMDDLAKLIELLKKLGIDPADYFNPP